MGPRPTESGMTPLELLKTDFGFAAFRQSQEQVIQHVLAGRHAMVVMPTGMGKSLCYQIPALTIDPDKRDGQN